MNFLRDHAALPEDADFEYPDFQEGQVVFLTNAPTTVDEVIIDSNGQASYVSRPNLIPRSVALRNMTAEQRGQPEPKAYLDKIEAHNKIVNKCSARHDSDTVKAINIIELSLSPQVRTAVSNNLKIKHGTTLEIVKAAGDPAAFMTHVAAVADILYLETISKEDTQSLLVSVVNYYKSLNFLKRKQWEQFSSYFVRFSKGLQIIKQCSLLLDDPSVVMTETHAITTLFANLNSEGYTNFHAYVNSVNHHAIHKQSTVAAQIQEFMRYTADADEKIKKDHQAHVAREHNQREKAKTPTRPANDRRPNPNKRDHSDINFTDESTDAYFTITDLLNAEIPKEKIDQLTKSAKTNPTATASSNSTSNPSSNSSSNPNPTISQPYANRGGRFQRGGRTPGRTPAGRSSARYIPTTPNVLPNPTGAGHFNADTNYYDESIYVILDDDDDIPCSCLHTSQCLHTQPRKRDHNDNYTSNNRLITQLHHDDGNSGPHILNSMKNLDYVREAGSTIVKSMTGLDPSWKSVNQLSGHHPLLGEVVYHPSARVSLINPNILTNDGWKLHTFSGSHGDVVKLYSRQFGQNTYFLEFIMNISGQLIANDPADDKKFIRPSQSPNTLGSLHSLREYLVLNHHDMMQEYIACRAEFFDSATDESQNHHVSFEGVSDSGYNDQLYNEDDQLYDDDADRVFYSSSNNSNGRQREPSSSQSETSNSNESVSDNP